MVKKAAKKKAKKAVKHGFVFIGNGHADPLITECFGYTFELNGEPVAVSEEHAVRLRKHTHFAEK